MRKLIALISLFLLAHCSACSGKRVATPTPQDVAITAVNTVDAALAVYITTSTADAGADAAFEHDVQLVEQAAEIVKSGASPCVVLPGLELVAKDVGCAQCVAPIVAAKGAFKCQ